MVAILATGSVATVSAEDGPIIVPERIQEIALEFPVSKRLEIDWAEAEASDVARYMGFLAATTVIAEKIAKGNSRERPSDDDYRAALTAQCIGPPNKPPLVQEYWESEVPAFYNSKVRATLREAVGPLAVEIASNWGEGQDKAWSTVDATWPTKADAYFDKVLNVRPLVGND
ncbi:hypothetical protein HW532_18485 [Kaustia mangrovi]|uniref:Uncharacterized protein n=1 Tax=Kaustia mangrovi TaxID=2593653 RepID=A0A7S8C6V6_9HYPH|nr:hypothetical protein [Kaustia mangrovi]QPC44508.1 hypothetical protein HW532_18485 [Kaustia mangrovi]